MLRSTGFFRGIDCPFYSEYRKGTSDKQDCKRPYCHFRHSKLRRTSYSASDTRKPEELNSKHNEQGYDPFNPDVVRPKDQGNGDSGTTSGDLGVLELELVNRAIAEVRNEVERERRKLSRIGDVSEEYEPTSRSAKGANRSKAVSEEYEPTSRSAKGANRSKAVSEEYEPTSRSAKGANRSKAVSEVYEPTSSSAKGANRSKAVSEEYEPTSSSAKGANRSKAVSEEYEPTSSSAKGANRSKAVSEEYEPTVTSYKTGAKRPKVTPEEYDPTTSLSRAGSKKPKTTHLAYDPGSYQITSTADYNPTPCVSKYTLDSDTQDNRASSLEYVPTSVCKASVKKPLPRVQNPPLPSPPPSPKHSNAPSSKSKYNLDHSKPSTDLEYDPLSNYSAKPSGKNKKEDAAKGEGNRKSKPSGAGRLSGDGEYVPTAVKTPRPNSDTPKYTLSLSESDGEGSGTEYRPTSLSRLQRRKSSTGSADDLGAAGLRDRARDALGGSKQRIQEQAEGKGDPEPGLLENCKNQETSRRKHKPDDDKEARKPSNAKSGKTEKALKTDKDASKKSSTGNKEKETGEKGDRMNASKRSSHQSPKKEGRSADKREGEKSKLREKSVNKRDEKRSEGGSGRTEKGTSDVSRREKERGGDSRKVKTLDRERDASKHKEPRNGQLGGKESEAKKRSLGDAFSSGGSSRGRASGSEEKKGSRVDGGRAGKVKRSLSHADLFGDESAEDSEDEEEVKLVRRSAAAIKRLGANKRKASELTPSSSEDEDVVGAEDERADEDLDGGGLDFPALQVDLDFDEDPMEECLRIFNESKDVKTEDKGRQAKQISKDSEDEEDAESTLTTLFPGQKKRVSHCSAKGTTDSAPKPAPYRRLTAQEICYRRMQIAQQQAVQLAAAVKTASATPRLTPSPRLTSSPKPSFPGERKRVAHRPSPFTSSSKPGAVEVKPTAHRVMSPTGTLPGQLSVKAHTSAGILSKTTTTLAQKRVAHTPTMKSAAMKRPVIPTEFGAKVPTNVRQRYLNTFIDECLKFCATEDLAFQMALDEEKVVYERSSSKNIYLNVAVNTLKKLRSHTATPPSPAAKSPAVKAGGNRKALSHEELLGGRLAAKTSFTLNRTGRQQEEKLMGAALYRKLREYLMTEEQLQQHSYPRPHPEGSGRALVHNVPEKKNTDPFSKVCCRCGAEYKLNVNGSCVRKEECHHHWGRLRRYKVSGGWETHYNCCSGPVGSTGCQVAKQHVQDGRKECLDGYVTTFDKSLPPDGNGGVFALDCEMCYTVLGLELTRVTVINSELKVIYDTFVKPESRVVDYNTRFSGVTEEDLENATITLRDVQAVLLSMFSAESILIGHSLESDLFALKLIHSTVVDTAIVFPHRLGLPYKRALRNLMADHLKRIIQDNVGGHDSSEDARACMELMTWKIKEDAKVKR